MVLITTTVFAMLSHRALTSFLFFPLCYTDRRVKFEGSSHSTGVRTSRSSITATVTLASFSIYGMPEASARLATWRQALREGMVVGDKTCAVVGDADRSQARKVRSAVASGRGAVE